MGFENIFLYQSLDHLEGQIRSYQFFCHLNPSIGSVIIKLQILIGLYYTLIAPSVFACVTPAQNLFHFGQVSKHCTKQTILASFLHQNILLWCVGALKELGCTFIHISNGSLNLVPTNPCTPPMPYESLMPQRALALFALAPEYIFVGS